MRSRAGRRASKSRNQTRDPKRSRIEPRSRDTDKTRRVRAQVLGRGAHTERQAKGYVDVYGASQRDKTGHDESERMRPWGMLRVDSSSECRGISKEGLGELLLRPRLRIEKHCRTRTTASS
jgi:hypothetical protein